MTNYSELVKRLRLPEDPNNEITKIKTWLVVLLAEAADAIEALRAEVRQRMIEADGLRHVARGNKLAAEAQSALRKDAEDERDQALARLASVIENTKTAMAMGDAGYGIDYDPDAQAALKRVVDATWNEAVEACADHCWNKRDLLADADKKQVEAGLTGRDYYGRRLEAELLSRSLRALARPTEGEEDV